MPVHAEQLQGGVPLSSDFILRFALVAEQINHFVNVSGGQGFDSTPFSSSMKIYEYIRKKSGHI